MRNALICALALAACGKAEDTAGLQPDPPTTSLVQTPEALTRSETATFGFLADDASATFACALDDGPAEACTSPATYTGLATGEHTFTVTASNAGGADPEPPSFAWTIAPPGPPVAQITAGPDAHWGSATATLWFVADGPATFACALDGGDPAPCTSPATYTGLADGEHTFTVAATADGQTQAVPASHAFRVDTTPPVTAIDDAPADPTNQTSAALVFSADEDASFTCQVDEGLPLPCASPATWSDLDAGPHRVRVWATDAVGNEEWVGATAEWVIDLDPPTTSLTASPPDPSNDTTPSFSFGSDEAGTFVCTLDGAVAPCTSPHATAEVGEGSHTFTVAAVDPAGNADPEPPSVTWTVDVTPPDAPASATATAGSRSVEVGWAAATDAAGYALYVDDGDAEERVAVGNATAHTIGDLVNCGTYTVSVVALDAAGNESQRATTNAVDPKPSAPEGVTLVGTTDGGVDLWWDGVEHATGYRLWYGATSGGPYDGTDASSGPSPVDLAETWTTETGLSPSTPTWFAVTALDGDCEGEPSQEVTYDCTNTLDLCLRDATVDGVTDSFREIWSMDQLAQIGSFPDDNYILMEDVSFDGDWTGTVRSQLTTHFHGNGKTLSDYNTSQALFGTVSPAGKVSDLTIRGATMYAGTNSGLVATENNGLIVRCDVEGTSSGGGYNGAQGLVVARNSGVIRDTVASGAVTTSAYANSAGGFVGINNEGGHIDGCTADVNVTGSSQAYILGGFAGMNSGAITRSSAHGSVAKSGSDSPSMGGFVGSNSGLVDLCWATGDVTCDNSYTSANSRVGGLVGQNGYGVVSRSYATGEVTSTIAAQNRVGGLVGQIEASYTTDRHGNQIPTGVVLDSYALGSVLGSAQAAGGFVGSNNGGVVKRSWSGGEVEGSSAGGFFGWYNVATRSALEDTFALGPAFGSSSTDPFGAYISSGTVDNGWFLGAVDDTSVAGAQVTTDVAVFVDADTYGPDATGGPSFPWDVDYIWEVDGVNLPTLQQTDIVLDASPLAAASGTGSIAATLTVTDEDGLPAPGVSVRLWSTSTTVAFSPETGTTDANGEFTSTVTASSAQTVSLRALVFDDLWAVPVKVTFE